MSFADFASVSATMMGLPLESSRIESSRAELSWFNSIHGQTMIASIAACLSLWQPKLGIVLAKILAHKPDRNPNRNRMAAKKPRRKLWKSYVSVLVWRLCECHAGKPFLCHWNIPKCCCFSQKKYTYNMGVIMIMHMVANWVSFSWQIGKM